MKKENDCIFKKNHLFVKIILGIIVAILLFGGGVIGGYVLTNGDEVKEENKDEKNDKIQIGEKYKFELFDENHVGYKDITLKEENIGYFVSNTDFINDDKMRPYFLEGTTDYNFNGYKIAYILSNYDEATCTYFVSLDFLNKEAKKVFSTGFEAGFESADHLYLNSTSINYVCDDNICMVSVIRGGGTGYSHPITKIASSRKDGENTIYTLKEYYLEFDKGFYDIAGGTLLCKDDCPEDMVGTYGDKLNTYEMTFDKNNKYVSSKKIN